MRYPVDNFKTEWNGTAGYGYGASTSYGFHDGLDINDNGAGNSDLGKPLYAIAKGKIIGVHQHTGTGNFGKHFFLQIEGTWGTRYVHYAHCNELFVKLDDEVQEGQKIATVGNTGTVYAHCHFAVKHKANGMDTIANTKAQLDDAWEDPIKFIEANMKDDIDAVRKERDANWVLYQNTLKELDDMRKQRDDNWNKYQEALKELEVLKTQAAANTTEATTKLYNLKQAIVKALNES